MAEIITDTQKPVSLPEYFKKGYALVVDDMPRMRKTIKGMLRQLGIAKVRDADDGDTAISVLTGAEEKCKFVLLDWNMPRMHGIEVAREIRADENLQDTPILMITAETFWAQVVQAGEIGVNGYIIKPFKAATLGDKILNILETRANPPEHVKLIKAGEELVKQEKYPEAMDQFQQSLKVKETARVLVNIGEVHEKLGNNEQAEKLYAEAGVLNENFLKAHLARAELLLKIGKEDEAIGAFAKASEISPNNAERQTRMGKMYLAKGDEKNAKKTFRAAIKLDPGKNNEIAEEYLSADIPEMAEVFFRNSLVNEAGSIHTYNRLGIALRHQGKWKEAVEEYKKAMEIDPEDAVLFFNIAKAFLDGDKKEKAQQNFKKALEMDPELEEAKTEMEKLA